MLYIKYHQSNDKTFKDIARDIDPDNGLVKIIGAALLRSARQGCKNIGSGQFTAEIRSSVQRDDKPGEVIVYSDHYAAAHKQFGGKVTAPGKGPGSTGAKSLAIPVSAEAKAARHPSPRMFPQELFMISYGLGQMGLFAESATGDEMEMHYVLKKSVTHRAFPWFPIGKVADDIVSKKIKQWLATR